MNPSVAVVNLSPVVSVIHSSPMLGMGWPWRGIQKLSFEQALRKVEKGMVGMETQLGSSVLEFDGEVMNLGGGGAGGVRV